MNHVLQCQHQARGPSDHPVSAPAPVAATTAPSATMSLPSHPTAVARSASAAAENGVVVGAWAVGSYVTFIGSSSQIPTGLVGEVLGQREDGRLAVRVPNGNWRCPPNPLVATPEA